MQAAPPGPAEVIRKATTDDVPRLAKALARAFYDDPVFKWLVPNDTERIRRSEHGFAFYLRKDYLPHDECYATERLGGAALSLPPEQWPLALPAPRPLAPRIIAAMGPRPP